VIVQFTVQGHTQIMRIQKKTAIDCVTDYTKRARQAYHLLLFTKGL